MSTERVDAAPTGFAALPSPFTSSEEEARILEELRHLLGTVESREQLAEALEDLLNRVVAGPDLDDDCQTPRSVAPGGSGSDRRSCPRIELSARQREVLELVTAGLSYAQIASELYISQSTVSYHLGNIYAKANVSSRHQLTVAVRTDPALFARDVAENRAL